MNDPEQSPSAPRSIGDEGSRGRIYVDLLKTDGHNALRLVTVGTQKDLKRYGIQLTEGLKLPLYTDDADRSGKRDDLIFSGTAHFNAQINEWVAIIDWEAIRPSSEAGER